jgi:superfamily I DNA/RNA helicase
VFGLREFYQKKQSGTAEPDMATDLIILEVLENYVFNFESLEAFYSHWQSLEDPEQAQKSDQGSEDGVQLSTIHSTKGNEYRHLVYFNLSDTVDQDESELEQERRVAYVGATRAIESLLITIPESNHSRFAEELFLSPEFYGMSDRKLQRFLRRLRKQRRNEEKSSANLSRSQNQSQMNVFSNRKAATQNFETVTETAKFLDELNARIEVLENELRYRGIFYPNKEK